MAVIASSFGQNKSPNKMQGLKMPKAETGLYQVQPTGKMLRLTKETTPEELLGCPEGTVFGGEFDVNADYSGFQSSDQGRAFKTKYFQYFSGCYYQISGLRFIGIFNFYNEDGDWVSCDHGELGKPIKFEISFYKEKDGLPGEKVYSKEIAITPKELSMTYGDYTIYEFTTELGQTVKMENGFVSISALPTEKPLDCWFALMANSSVAGYGLLQMGGDEDYAMAALPTCYCFKGNGEFIAKKALKINRILSPRKDSNNKYEKVQVELQNIGSESLNNTRLELWADGKLLATENIEVEVKSLEFYKYTFKQRIDCSAPGEHHFVIKNVTPQDEGIAISSVNFTTTKVAAGNICQSESTDAASEFIKKVTIGEISNISKASTYSDFSDLKTSIISGQELKLSVEAKSGDGNYIGVWTDWNGNGSSSDEGDFITYITQDAVTVKIPENTTVTTGEKRMRIIISYGKVDPCGMYDYGETEDYTLIVKRPDESSIFSIDKEYFEISTQTDESKKLTLELSNNGNTEMTGDISINYSLPYSPNNRHITKAGKAEAKELKPIMINKSKVRKAPQTAPETQYTLKYDKEQYSAIGLSSGEMAVYASYYPGETLANLAGMQIASIDVYIENVSDYSAVVIYGPNNQSSNGELITEQVFTPIADSWNTIRLTEPVFITGKDLWIGVKFKGLKANSYQIGTDKGPAIIGFGDVVNVGGSKWWSLADLGMNSNTSIHANVTGERTPAINWITTDKKNYSVSAQETGTLDFLVNTSHLATTLYEAVIEITSNDALSGMTKVPVYLSNDSGSSIDSVKDFQSAAIYTSPDKNYISILAGKVIKEVTLIDITGKKIRNIQTGKESETIDTRELSTGIYIISIVYQDNSRENAKISILR